MERIEYFLARGGAFRGAQRCFQNIPDLGFGAAAMGFRPALQRPVRGLRQIANDDGGQSGILLG